MQSHKLLIINTLNYKVFTAFQGESLMTNALKLILNHIEAKTDQNSLKAHKLGYKTFSPQCAEN